VVFNNPFDQSLPTTLNFSVPGLASRELMDVFDAAQVRVSSGSACSAAKAAPSYVLDAMHAPLWRSAGAIRMSFGPLVDEATITDACARIERCGAALRASCLIPSERTAVPHDGLLQLGVEGACSWMVLDAASRGCIVIDPLPEMSARIESYVRCQNYQVQAIVSTLPNAGRAMLIDALGRHFDSQAETDVYGWPVHAASVALDNGALVGAIQLGAQVLASVPGGTGGELRNYLLGAAEGARLPAAAVRFAFSARPAQEALRAVSAAQTLLCPTRDEHNQFCISMTDQPQAGLATDAQLDSAALDAFLQAHPHAMLIDVREPYEFAAGASAPGAAGSVVRSVPLSRLAEHASDWLRGEPAPLVFFCRSGNRSLKAAQFLRRLGHPHAYSLVGGLALAPLPLAA
jgi:rhodanese-related sulfurtransferase